MDAIKTPCRLSPGTDTSSIDWKYSIFIKRRFAQSDDRTEEAVRTRLTSTANEMETYIKKKQQQTQNRISIDFTLPPLFLGDNILYITDLFVPIKLSC
jgi:hypothetical protein